jgi:hypothetical protein
MEPSLKALHSEIEIAAPAQRVWDILADTAAYPSWNPFIRRLEGTLRPGAGISVRIEPPGGTAMTFRPTVLAAEAGRELRWLGHLLVPGLFDGEHRFAIEPLDGGRVRFVQEEQFRGLLVPLFAKGLDSHTRAGFEAMNQALKARAEGPTAREPSAREEELAHVAETRPTLLGT